MTYHSASYTPYGAYELKATYQRNFALSTVITTTFVLLLLTAGWIASGLYVADEPLPPPIPRDPIDWPKPPTVTQERPQVNVKPPQAVAPRVGIPTPVPDEWIMDENVMIATKDQLAEINAPVDGSTYDGFGYISDTGAAEYLPGPEDFVPVEIYPEFVYRRPAEYPRLAQQAGITGTVIMYVVVDEKGNVIKAEVYKSSGTVSLDEAALRAAYKCKFKPGIQNGRPVKVGVTYEVGFELTE
jgi:protein TonB